MEHVTSYLHANRWRKRSTIILWHKLNHNMGMASMPGPGSGTPWYILTRLGGGNLIAIQLVADYEYA
jgi:hypothetical protein